MLVELLVFKFEAKLKIEWDYSDQRFIVNVWCMSARDMGARGAIISMAA